MRALIVSAGDLAAGMHRTNVLLGEDMPAGRFVTAFFGALDPQAHRLDYVSAGHGPLLLLRAATGIGLELPASTLPMGILPELDTRLPEPIQLQPGDTLLLVTDGFFEWINPAKETFGTRRIFDLVRADRRAPSAELIRRLHEAVLAFAEGTPQNDDLTAIIVRRQ